MRRGRARIPPRIRVFFGCEGESEQGYGALLQHLADAVRKPHVTLDLQVIGGGDPLAIVEEASRRAKKQAHKHGEFAVRAVLLDRDKLGQTPGRDAQIPALAAANGLLLIRAEPCFEGLLLRHLRGCQALRPATSADALAALLRQWPEYAKPMSRARLITRIGHNEIRAAATVEPELYSFLRAIKFL
jgi:hypothetical protein